MLDDLDPNIESDNLENNNFAQNNINKNQKIAATVLVFFAVITILLWVMQFKKNIAINSLNTTPQEQTNIATEKPANVIEEDMKNKDTDNDKLTDWEELNLYNTSPYLEDSDSDGLSDSEEIASDSDPNCPEGRDCTENILSEKKSSDSDMSTENVDTLNQLLKNFDSTANQKQDSISNQSDSSIESELLGEAFGDLEPSVLREMLLEYGMDKKVLDQIGDEDLKKDFAEMLK